MSFVGRTIDLLGLNDPKYDGSNVQVEFNTGSRARVVTGVQKAVQRWLYVFLTRQGSVLGDPSLGTKFLDEILNGNSRDESLVKQSFNSAERTAHDYLAALETAATPFDERIKQVDLLNYSLIPGRVRITVLVTTQAGTQREVILPIGVAI